MTKHEMEEAHNGLVVAWAEHVNGSGWTNLVVHLLWRDSESRLRVGMLQPEEQTAEMRTLFAISDLVSRSMTNAVSRMLFDVSKREKREVDEQL